MQQCQDTRESANTGLQMQTPLENEAEDKGDTKEKAEAAMHAAAQKRVVRVATRDCN